MSVQVQRGCLQSNAAEMQGQTAQARGSPETDSQASPVKWSGQLLGLSRVLWMKLEGGSGFLRLSRIHVWGQLVLSYKRLSTIFTR